MSNKNLSCLSAAASDCNQSLALLFYHFSPNLPARTFSVAAVVVCLSLAASFLSRIPLPTPTYLPAWGGVLILPHHSCETSVYKTTTSSKRVYVSLSNEGRQTDVYRILIIDVHYLCLHV